MPFYLRTDHHVPSCHRFPFIAVIPSFGLETYFSSIKDQAFLFPRNHHHHPLSVANGDQLSCLGGIYHASQLPREPAILPRRTRCRNPQQSITSISALLVHVPQLSSPYPSAPTSKISHVHSRRAPPHRAAPPSVTADPASERQQQHR